MNSVFIIFIIINLNYPDILAFYCAVHVGPQAIYCLTLSFLDQPNCPFVILLCLTPDDVTHQGRASGWERVNWANLPISLP